MKFTTVTTTAALLGLAAVEAKTRGQATDRDAHDARRLSSSKKSGKGSSCNSECEGFTFYEYVNVAETLADPTASPPVPTPTTVTFPQALKAAPEGCVLAPVTSEAELLEIQLAIPGVDLTWIGITKSAEQVKAEVDDGAMRGDRVENWFNLDGSEVPADIELWDSVEPNSPASPLQTKGLVRTSGKLADAPPISIDGIVGAVYKCCAEESDFCFGQGMVM